MSEPDREPRDLEPGRKPEDPRPHDLDPGCEADNGEPGTETENCEPGCEADNGEPGCEAHGIERQREPRDRELDRFSQEANAFMDLNETQELMVQEARSVLSKHPDADPVGLLFQRDAPLVKGVLTALEKATGQTLFAKGFLGVMPRSLANQILKDESPNLLAELAHAPGGKGSSRRLPIICMTKSGSRMLVVGYEAPEPWEGEP